MAEGDNLVWHSEAGVYVLTPIGERGGEIFK